MKRPRIKSLSGTTPHPSYRGWRGFLDRVCKVRGEYKGAVWYGATNCNYIVFPDGKLVQNYGYHGEVLFNRIRELGINRVERKLIKEMAELRAAIDKCLGKKEQDEK